MSVVGIDFGNESGVVAVARQRGIDVVLNDESKCEIPALVCFGYKRRFLGTATAGSGMMNPNRTISQIKRLIGRQFSDPELQRDIKTLPFSVTEGPDGYPLIHAQYLGENRSFTPTQVLGMVLSDLKSIAEKNLNSAVVDCCIGIPVYFTDLQRRAVIDAATIAGLHPLHLIHETTATALAYGIYKTDLHENEQLNVAFIDIGHASMQVCIAVLKEGQLKILAHAFDRSLGGRDFDEVLFQYFADKYKTEYKIDVYHNARACLRLRAGCEKLKKVLSANPVAHLNIECLMDEKDVRSVIKRDEFEEISIPILERMKKPLEKALADAGLTLKNIYAVEIVGSGSRVPAINKMLTDFFGKEPRGTMNASECVAKGCALQCAILSPTFKVRDFQVTESFPFPIAISWKGTVPYFRYGAAENQQSTIVFPKGHPIPSLEALTFYRAGTFTVDVQYADVSELKAPPRISTYTIGPFQSSKGERAKVKVKVRLSLHGIVSVESATLLEEEEVEVPAVTEASKMEIETKVEPPRKILKKTKIPVTELVYGGMSYTDVQRAVEMELEMALQDRVMEKRKDKKNSLESYIYDMRDKLLEDKKVKIPVVKEASKMDTDEASGKDAPPFMILEGIPLSNTVAEIKDVKFIDDFNLKVGGVNLNSVVPSYIREKYYDLCRSQRSYLHQNLLEVLNYKLADGIISETVFIADAIRGCSISSSGCRDKLLIWDKKLKAFQELGMNVGLLRERICKLEGLITRQESKQIMMNDKMAEKEKAEEEMRNMSRSLMDVNNVIKKLGDEIDKLKNNEIGLKVFFEEAANAPW